MGRIKTQLDGGHDYGRSEEKATQPPTMYLRQAGLTCSSKFVIFIPFGVGDRTQFQIPARSQILALAVIEPGQFGHLTGDTLLTKIFYVDK